LLLQINGCTGRLKGVTPLDDLIVVSTANLNNGRRKVADLRSSENQRDQGLTGAGTPAWQDVPPFYFWPCCSRQMHAPVYSMPS
jgi:hypothetical protein